MTSHRYSNMSTLCPPILNICERTVRYTCAAVMKVNVQIEINKSRIFVYQYFAIVRLSNHNLPIVMSSRTSFPKEDEGWGWVIVASSFVGRMLLDGIFKGMGVLLPTLSAYFNVPVWSIGYTISLMHVVGSTIGKIQVNLFNLWEKVYLRSHPNPNPPCN